MSRYFFFKFIYWDYFAHYIPIWPEYQTFHKKGAWAEREREEGLSFFFPPPSPTPLESLILRPFYVWCPSISNPNLSVQLLQPRGRGRTGYETRFLQPFDFDCNVVNRLKQTNNNLPSTPIYFHRWALSWTYCGNTRTNDMHMRSNIVGLIQLKISVNNVITASWVTKYDNQLKICYGIKLSWKSFLVENGSFTNLWKIYCNFCHFI